MDRGRPSVAEQVRMSTATQLVGRLNVTVSGEDHVLLWAVEVAGAAWGLLWGWHKWLRNVRSAVAASRTDASASSA